MLRIKERIDYLMGSRTIKDKIIKSHFNQHSIYLILICIFILTVTSMKNSLEQSFTPKSTHVLENNNMHETVLLRNSKHIYIDVGCYDGETVEYFMYFTPDSLLYDIIVFEPDPTNYYLCKSTLMQKKYEKYNITILPMVAWTRYEKVPYLINQGHKSGIASNETSEHLFRSK